MYLLSVLSIIIHLLHPFQIPSERISMEAQTRVNDTITWTVFQSQLLYGSVTVTLQCNDNKI